MSIPKFVPISVIDVLSQQHDEIYIGPHCLKLTGNNLKKAQEDLQQKFPYTSPSVLTIRNIIKSNICHVCGEYKGDHQSSIQEYPSTCPRFETNMCSLLNISESYVEFLKKNSRKTKLEAKEIHLTILAGKGYMDINPPRKQLQWSPENYTQWLQSQICTHCHQYHLNTYELCRLCSKCGLYHIHTYMCMLTCKLCNSTDHISDQCTNLRKLRQVAKKTINMKRK